MSDFLINREYSIYTKYPTNFTLHTCKDIKSKKKEYKPTKTDEIPKDIPNFGFVHVSVGKYPIKITTPIMLCPFGFNRKISQLALQFTNVQNDPEMNGFFTFIQELEMEQMKYLGLSEEESDLYLSQIRFDKNNKYDPNLLIKVPFVKNKYEVDIRNNDEESSIAQIYNFSKLKCDIYIDNIWKYNGKFVCKWKVDKVLIM